MISMIAYRVKIHDIETLVVQMARENAHWGYDRIEGELIKHGYTIDRSTIRNLRKRHHLLPGTRAANEKHMAHLLAPLPAPNVGRRLFHGQVTDYGQIYYERSAKRLTETYPKDEGGSGVVGCSAAA